MKNYSETEISENYKPGFHVGKNCAFTLYSPEFDANICTMQLKNWQKCEYGFTVKMRLLYLPIPSRSSGEWIICDCMRLKSNRWRLQRFDDADLHYGLQFTGALEAEYLMRLHYRPSEDCELEYRDQYTNFNGEIHIVH